jgi:CHAT domain-containing protein
VVASLWEVSDEASAALMARFHAALAAGEPVDRALKKAQAAIQEQNADWKHPYFWAAFAAYRQ